MDEKQSSHTRKQILKLLQCWKIKLKTGKEDRKIQSGQTDSEVRLKTENRGLMHVPLMGHYIILSVHNIERHH